MEKHTGDNRPLSQIAQLGFRLCAESGSFHAANRAKDRPDSSQEIGYDLGCKHPVHRE